MLDRRDAVAQSSHDSRFAMTVRCDDALGSGGFLDDCTDLFVAELLVDGMIEFAHDSAGCADLDQPRAEAKLPPHLMQTFRHAVTQREDGRCSGSRVKHVERKSMNVGMTAGHAEHTSGRIHVRSRNRSLGNDAREVNSQAPNFANRGDPAIQRALGVFHGARGGRRDWFSHQGCKVGPNQPN